MAYHDKTLRALINCVKGSTVVSITGKSGTGKTTLAQMMVGNLLTEMEPYEDCCVWVQASEQFSKLRLETLFKNIPGTMAYIMDNIFIIPEDHCCRSYIEQSSTLKKLTNPSSNLPPFISCIVVDNISHHLRYEASNVNISSTMLFQNDFFEKQLSPLIFYCSRENITLILIHEATSVPSKDREGFEIKAFNYKLFDRINQLNIGLVDVFNRPHKEMVVQLKGASKSLKYTLEDCGFVFKA